VSTSLVGPRSSKPLRSRIAEQSETGGPSSDAVLAGWLGALGVLVAILPPSAFARELWSSDDGEREVSLDSAFKATGMLSYAPDDPFLYPDPDTSSSLERLRLTLGGRLSEAAVAEVAWEIRARTESADAGVVGLWGFLPSTAEAPWRLEPLDWSISESGNTSSRHEIDRALVAFDLEWGERSGQITVGRQAVGLGRGVLFSAVDIFAPFSPFDVDREWRRGVDAARVDFMLTDTVSFDFIAAFGADRDNDALIGRLRGYSAEANIDAEIVLGTRARDRMYAGTFSWVLGEAEVHLELALFDIPEHAGDGELFGADHLTSKLVLGGSYNFDVGRSGLKTFLEYHYSGFGVDDIADLPMRLLTDPAFGERLARGDTQMLGQHAVAIQVQYELSDEWSLGATWITSPVDWSGMISPVLTWNMADNATMVFAAHAPHGSEPDHGMPTSEYGSAPVTLLLQLRVYD